MKKTTTRPLLIIFTALALIGVGLWYFLFSSIHKHIEAAAAYQVQTAAKESKQSRDQSLKSFLADSTTTIAALSESTIDSDGTVSFIDSVEGLARGMNLGVLINSVSTSNASASTTGLEYLDLSVTVQGSWTATYQFLSALETLPNDLTITSANLDQSTFTTTGTSSRSTWEGNIVLSALKNK